MEHLFILPDARFPSGLQTDIFKLWASYHAPRLNSHIRLANVILRIQEPATYPTCTPHFLGDSVFRYDPIDTFFVVNQ